MNREMEQGSGSADASPGPSALDGALSEIVREAMANGGGFYKLLEPPPLAIEPELKDLGEHYATMLRKVREARQAEDQAFKDFAFTAMTMLRAGLARSAPEPKAKGPSPVLPPDGAAEGGG
jgi:hypothetical protein